jgi:hypothetical protein
MVETFERFRRGLSAIECRGNWDMEELDFSVKMEPTYPWCIPDDNYCMPYQIENDVPVPPKFCASQVAEDAREALGKLEIGQSFFIPFDNYTESYIRSVFSYAKKLWPDRYFISRKTIAAGKAGLRCWRVTD